MEECENCKGKLVKKTAMDSGNSTFVTYQCTSCGKTYTRCVGLNPATTRY